MKKEHSSRWRKLDNAAQSPIPNVGAGITMRLPCPFVECDVRT